MHLNYPMGERERDVPPDMEGSRLIPRLSARTYSQLIPSGKSGMEARKDPHRADTEPVVSYSSFPLIPSLPLTWPRHPQPSPHLASSPAFPSPGLIPNLPLTWPRHPQPSPHLALFPAFPSPGLIPSLPLT